MAMFADTEQVEAVLETLRTREDGPFVVRLPRQAGRRDSQWTHLFSGAVEAAPENEEIQVSTPAAVVASGAPSRIERLESEVRQLREELDSLKKQLGVG
jgi:uncharacterized protein YceH (UPF0502 family)